jgi:hypothetical protein
MPVEPALGGEAMDAANVYILTACCPAIADMRMSADLARGEDSLREVTARTLLGRQLTFQCAPSTLPLILVSLGAGVVGVVERASGSTL